ncbi:hypothetical protein PACTADRAFT_71659 [Pachysolen tannophilus NRRL Y-2460]|uniref:Bacterial surface antigen (D15) domain-containing protein n=1 Tax=Pachysolen tannophilus NRRL Y-2460 TaxID=669874 RepID=A0A1E4TPR8_PACTA|nr:hypothetical protein PACTADRAFT_71659 [Pachysolen tannophilus NRRL Y-2460]
MSLNENDSVIERISEIRPSQERKSELELLQEQKLEIVQSHTRNYLNSILEQNASKPMRIQSLNVVGAQNFRESFLKRQLYPLLVNDKLTLENLLENIDAVKLNFLKTQTISNLNFKIDSAYFKSRSTPANGIDLLTTLQLIPVKNFTAKIGTNVGNGEGDAYLTVNYRNIFGAGENLTFDTNVSSSSIGAKTRSTYLLNFNLPFNNNPNWRLDNIAYSTNRLIDWCVPHEQHITGFTNRISSQYEFFNHEFSVENILRTIKLTRPTTTYTNQFTVNDDILSQCGESFKSSFIYSLKFDSRDNPLLPSSGVLFKNSTELAGLIPLSSNSEKNAKFIKNQFEFQLAQKLTSNNLNFFNFSLRGGYIHNLSSTNNTLNIMDRFYLGGPNDLRGFALNGLGPKLSGSPIGGNFFYGGNLSLFNHVPKTSIDSNFKIHSFVNFGKLLNIKDLSDHDNFYENILKDPSVATGFGIVYKHPVARFELNR